MVKILKNVSNRSDLKKFAAARSMVKSLVLATFFLSAFTDGRGQVSSQLWGTKFETIIGAGYDSNINGTRERGTEDGFVEAIQTFEVSRLNSLTMFNVASSVSSTQFLNERDPDFVEGGLEVNAAFPNDAVDVTYWRARAYINRLTQVNLDAGRRFQPTL